MENYKIIAYDFLLFFIFAIFVLITLIVLLRKRNVTGTYSKTKIDGQFKTITEPSNGIVIVGVESFDSKNKTYVPEEIYKAGGKTIFAAYLDKELIETDLPVGTLIDLIHVEEKKGTYTHVYYKVTKVKIPK